MCFQQQRCSASCFLEGVGTPLYMAPEVISGAAKYDAKRADIWWVVLLLHAAAVKHSAAQCLPPVCSSACCLRWRSGSEHLLRGPALLVCCLFPVPANGMMLRRHACCMLCLFRRSCGVILFTILFGQYPFQEDKDFARRIVAGQWAMPQADVRAAHCCRTLRLAALRHAGLRCAELHGMSHTLCLRFRSACKRLLVDTLARLSAMPAARFSPCLLANCLSPHARWPCRRRSCR